MQYTPIVRADPTCLLAVARSTARPTLAPVLMLDNEDLAQLSVRAARLRFVDHVLGVDVRSERRGQVLRTPHEVFAPLVTSGAKCRPVFSIDDDPIALRELGAWAAGEGSQLILRMRVFALGARERLQQAMVLATAATRRSRDEIHVLLDQVDDLSPWACEQLVPLLCENGPWASITVAAGSAPAIASVTRRGEWIRAERRELAIGRQLAELEALGTPLGIGDYANRHPLLEANLTHARGNGFRWSTNHGWMVLREAPTLDGDQRRAVLARLVELGVLDVARPRSWGERSLARYLVGRAEPDQLNAWMVNHHIEIAAADVVPELPERTAAVAV